jgi:hypothetical protein
LKTEAVRRENGRERRERGSVDRAGSRQAAGERASLPARPVEDSVEKLSRLQA